MREILFRGKTQQHTRWIYGDLNHYMCDDGVFIAENGHSMHRVIKDTVGQYTGLIDKNGRKIFEGDICDFSILKEHTLVKITIQHSCVGFEPLDYDSVHPDDRIWRSFWRNDDEAMWDTDYFTVIGNLHDNPELLGGNTDVLS